MENLSIQDQPPQGTGPPQQQSRGGRGPGVSPSPAGGAQQPPIPQLPPQMFTTAASLLDLTDKKLIVSLRDGRKLIGVLRSWDQYGNLVLQNTIERRFAENLFADLNRGIYLVRGENIMLMGEIDLDKDDLVPPHCEPATPTAVLEAQKRVDADRKRRDAVRQRRLRALGFEGEHSGEALF